MYKIIGADLKEYGPVSVEQLRQWIREGRVNGQTKVQVADSTEWKSMADCPEFADVWPKTPQSLPTPSVPITPMPAQPRNSQTAVWSLVTGIASLLCCCICILGPVAIVLGIVALSQLKSHPELTGRGFAITGIVLGIVSLLLGAALWAVLFSSPDFMQALRNAAQQQ